LPAIPGPPQLFAAKPGISGVAPPYAEANNGCIGFPPSREWRAGGPATNGVGAVFVCAERGGRGREIEAKHPW